MADEITDAEALDLANRLEAFLRPLIAAPAAIRKAAQVSRGIEAMEKRKVDLGYQLTEIQRLIRDAQELHKKNMADAQVEYEAKTNELNGIHLANMKTLQAELEVARKAVKAQLEALTQAKKEWVDSTNAMQDEYDEKEQTRLTRIAALDKQIADREAVLSKVKSEAKKTQDALRQAGL